ncbi:hypothetical protein EVA_09637 [gut metagenome]|uniref:Uncharacterized protein n=1 Tax=gut metagenome TaxID=749906 RepID=J9GJP2_9ZZZZ
MKEYDLHHGRASFFLLIKNILFVWNLPLFPVTLFIVEL